MRNKGQNIPDWVIGNAVINILQTRRQKADNISIDIVFLLLSSKEFHILILKERFPPFFSHLKTWEHTYFSLSSPLPKATGFCGGNLGGGGLGGTWDGFAGLSDMGHLLIVP